jgi:hypothetical protein
MSQVHFLKIASDLNGQANVICFATIWDSAHFYEKKCYIKSLLISITIKLFV